MPILKSSRKGVFKASKAKQEGKAPKIAKITILTIVGFLCASLWLASTTTVPEVTRAGGELKPLGGYQQVQSSEGGVVFDVFVSEGQVVEANEVLAILRSTALSDEIRDMNEKIRSSLIEMSNLEAMQVLLSSPEVALQGSIPELRSDGLGYAASRLSVLAIQQAAQAEIIEELERTLIVQNEASSLTAKRVKARKIRLDRVEMLHAKRLITLRELDDQRDTLDQLRATQVDVDVRLSSTKKELSEAKAVIEQERLNLQETLIAEMFRLTQEIEGYSVRLEALEERSDALKVRAPDEGTVQGVAFPNNGELIAPGETIFELLPANSQLIAEVEFAPVDIGHIANGDAVTLKLDTFDARRYGDVKGKIVSISPNLVLDPNTGREFFRATVSLDQDTIGEGVWERNLRAGMVATAEVITAERTAIAYLLKPVVRSFNSAFGER